MSELKEAYLLSEYKIDEKDKEMNIKINKFEDLEKKGLLYSALYEFENLILQDGTSSKYNNKFLNFIIDNFENLLKEIKDLKSNLPLKEEDYKNYSLESIRDVNKYDFYYLRDCFDKYEVTLNSQQSEKILKKKKNYNEKVIKNNPEIKVEYYELLKNINNNKKISADSIHTIINNLNAKIIKECDCKLLYLYKYLDCNLINNNKIFTYLAQDKLYLNQYNFGLFNNLGIAIGYSDNKDLLYRYLFLLIKNKVNKNEIDYKDKNNRVTVFVFETFERIFANIKENIFKFIKYFVFIFVYIIFDGPINLDEIYDDNISLSHSYFKILCDQFLIEEKIDYFLLSYYEAKGKKKVEFKNNSSIVYIKDKEIILDNNKYSLNSFIRFLFFTSKKNNESLAKNYSQKLLCDDKIYKDYHDDYINLLKNICQSNTVTILQSLHEDFKQYKSFYSNIDVRNDLFDNRLKFMPFECSKIYGITDKYLLEIYLSSIYIDKLSNYDKKLNNNYEEILLIFNMSLNSAIFQHEALSHYIRGYLFYYNNNDNRKISIDTKKNYDYYPKQKLDKIEVMPKYLNKFKYKLNENEINELKTISNIDYQEFLDESTEKEKESNTDNKNNDDDDDEGYYYERQLFAKPNEKKLTKFNFLQALMLLDEDVYNLDPVHFHYCFLQLEKNKDEFLIFKENFRSNLLKKILSKINLTFQKEIKNIIMTAQRSTSGDLCIEFERSGYDVMSAYSKENN